MPDNIYDKKIELSKKLGALKFQKFVFSVEKVKWKIVKAIIPNYIKIADKIIDSNKNKQIKKLKDKNEIDLIQRNATMQKMLLRKEYNKNENINYHINIDQPTQFINELNWNKAIHQRNLIYNLILLPIGIVGMIKSFPLATVFTFYEALSTFTNFECINIQNYNINRIKRLEEKLRLKEQKKENQQMEKYKDAYLLINKKIEEKKDIVNIDEIISNINSKEELEQLKALIKIEKDKRNIKTNNIGGKKI